MPSLGLGASGGKQKNRTPHVFAQHDFNSDIEGFTGSDANLALYSLGLSTPCLQVDCTDTNGYGYKEYSGFTQSTRYYWRVKLAVGELGSGNKKIQIGHDGAGSTNYHDVTQNIPGVTTVGNFYFSHSSITSLFLSLQQQFDNKFAGWDDILIETWD